MAGSGRGMTGASGAGMITRAHPNKRQPDNKITFLVNRRVRIIEEVRLLGIRNRDSGDGHSIIR